MNGTYLTKRPAIRFLLLLVTGILLASQINVLASWCVIAFAILYCITLGLLCRLASHPVVNLFTGLLVILMGFSLQSRQREAAAEMTLSPVDEDRIYVSGWIDGEPVRQEKKTTFVVKTDLIRWAGRDDAVRRRILTTLKGKDEGDNNSRLECGTRIVAKGMLQPFPFPRNPGEFDYGRYLTLNDIQGMVTIDGSQDLAITRESSLSNFNALVGAMQRKLYGLIDRFHSAEHASFLKGVILGYRADLSTEIKQSFMNTGTVHILAVSGSNVAVVVLIIYSMFGFLRLPKKLTGFGTIIGIVLFTFITGASPSVVRAGIMATVILLGTMFERRTDIYNSLSVAAIIILLLDTNSLFDVGFQLSFAAVLSIVYFYPILVKFISLIPERFEEIKAIDYLFKLLAVSLAAQIGTLPFTAFYFGRVSLVSLVANLIVVPLSGLNVLLGIATVAVSSISSFGASCYAALNGVAMWFLLGFVKVAGSVPYAYVETARFEPLHAMLYYGLVATLFHVANPSIVKWGIAASLIVLNLLMYRAILHNHAKALSVTVIDVGQGDAILVELPNGRNILIDAGQKQFKYDAGERFILPLLKRKGIGSLDAILITHSHSDHIGGIPFLVKNLPVTELMEADVKASSSLYREVKELCSEERIRIHDLQRGMRISIDSTVRLYVLHPKTTETLNKSLNNTSVVVKLVYGKTSMLLVGDADNEAEDQIDKCYGDFLDSDILKVGHHGSKTSSGERFVRYLSPAVSLISVGIRNKFGHPSPAIIERLTTMNSQVRRTDREGALVYESDGQQWRNIEWKMGNVRRLVVPGH